jgi:maleamate amidohydrolase
MPRTSRNDTGNEWDGIIPDYDLQTYDLAGFGRDGGLGRRPALVIIDMQHRTLGTRTDIQSAIRDSYPTAVGNAGWDALDKLVPVLNAARKAGVPVVYPHVAPKSSSTLGRLGGKVPSIIGVDARGYEFPDEIAPRDGDVLIPKKHPSAFFATAMTSELIDRGVDTLIVAGCSTSGCVRSSVADAFSLNFRVGVVRDSVYDRSDVSHAVNLFDMANKYADLISAREAVDYFNDLPTPTR